jgi:CRISPR-associated endoribonuclease Cas6
MYMRLNVTVKFLEKNPKIRPDYPRVISKYTKKSLSLSSPEMYNYYYLEEKRALKPFTFSIKANLELQDNYFLVKSDILTIHYSFLDPAICLYVYNGILSSKNSPQIFEGVNHTISDISLKKNPVFNSNEVVFKTVSPIIVRKFNHESRKCIGFLGYKDREFIEGLITNIKILARKFLNTEIESRLITIDILKMKSTFLKNYGGEIGNTGILKITAPIEIIKLIYFAGIGAKRSQGFGMLEVVG